MQPRPHLGAPLRPTQSQRQEPVVRATHEPALPRLDSAQLFGGGNEVHIAHAGAVYRLRITALGKLILTK